MTSTTNPGNDALTKLRTIVKEQADAQDPFLQDVAALRRELAGTVVQLGAELETLKAVDAETRDAWTALEASCPAGRPDDPPVLQAALAARRSSIAGALRVLDTYPPQITRLLADIESENPPGLRGHSLAVAIDTYRRQAAPWLGSAAPLRGGPARVADQTKEITALTERLLAAARAGGIVAGPRPVRAAAVDRPASLPRFAETSASAFRE